MKVHIVQCLCGPARHCIIALAYLPGQTSAQNDDFSDITLTEENATAYLQKTVDRFIRSQAIDPWCGLCKAKRENWLVEDAITIFDSIEEAKGPLKELAERQAATRRLFGARN